MKIFAMFSSFHVGILILQYSESPLNYAVPEKLVPRKRSVFVYQNVANKSNTFNYVEICFEDDLCFLRYDFKVM
jgi:hypothetical protein